MKKKKDLLHLLQRLSEKGLSNLKELYNKIPNNKDKQGVLHQIRELEKRVEEQKANLNPNSEQEEDHVSGGNHKSD